MSEGPLLQLEDLSVHFPVHGGVLRRRVGAVKAVDGVSLAIHRGETIGLVGESGSGKTTVGRAIVNLHRAMTPDVELSGHVWFESRSGRVDVNGLGRAEMLPHRAELAMIFQDPFSSLNPRMTVEQIVGGPLEIHEPQLSAADRKARVLQLLERVGLQPQYAARYPHEFSGGQRQRVGIARALALRPKLIVCDEAVSALDVSIQAQVINLLKDLQEEFGLSYVFIAHDLSVVRYISDRVAVMYLGRIVEMGTVDQVFDDPQHPYTRALLSAIPRADRSARRERIPLTGDVPSPISPPSGCYFHTRCPVAEEGRCDAAYPETREVGPAGHVAACHLAEARG